ncbi:MAG: copper amine oxidase N-terminal domain-containing protein [Clostridiales bacterium]|nr:copper amine oxidase N-terminal domain-containing protein [Clostridiales bacterium]
MKKLNSSLLMLALCFTLLSSTAAAVKLGETYSAIATNNAIVVSNSTDAPDAHLVHPAVYKIEGANYFKLRDIAMLLNGSDKQFAVNYDDNAKAVSITSGKPYTAIGGELSGTAAASCSAIESNNTISINGNSSDLKVFKIDGANYFKLRDLGQALDFYVGYDDETKTVTISGAKGYKTTENIGFFQETIVLKEPPALTVVCGENKSIRALKGTYSWKYQKEDGTEIGINADSMHPLTAKKYMQYLENLDSSRASLLWTTAPDDVSVRCWSEECWGQFDAKSENIPVEVFETEALDGSYSRGFMIELKGGSCIYEVIAKWDSFEKYNGTASYSFYTDMKDRSGLREQFPQYFDLSTFKGLEVYVWSMAEGSYRCGVLAGTNRNKTWEEIMDLSLHSVSVEEMKQILASYDIPDEEVFLLACHQPISSFAYEIDSAYCAAVAAQFDNRYACFSAPEMME